MQNNSIFVVPPHLVFTYYTTYYNRIQQRRLDASEAVNLYSSGRARALDFDFRFELHGMREHV